AATISPDGKLAATGGGTHQEIRIWELATGAPVKSADGKPLVLAGAGEPAWGVGFSPDGQRIAWGNVPHPGGNQLSQLQFQLQLPATGRPLGRPEPIDKADASAFARARAISGSYALAAHKGGRYGYDAILDLKENNQVIRSIELGSTDGEQHRSFS